MLKILQADTLKHLEAAKALFEEYAHSLAFDLGFQDFTEEVVNLPGSYAPPKGCLLLATQDDRMAGCVALREISDGICEMKRLYVRPEFRSLGIGKALAEAVIEKARRAGYNLMRLDMVLPRDVARGLYKSLGFKDIEPYRSVFDQLNPIYFDDIPEDTFNPTPDCHMNNKAHRLVAQRIVSAIKSGSGEKE